MFRSFYIIDFTLKRYTKWINAHQSIKFKKKCFLITFAHRFRTPIETQLHKR